MHDFEVDADQKYLLTFMKKVCKVQAGTACVFVLLLPTSVHSSSIIGLQLNSTLFLLLPEQVLVVPSHK